MTKSKGANLAEIEPKRDRIHLDVIPEDKLKFLFLQAKSSAGQRKQKSLSDLAHEHFFRKLPNPPRSFKPLNYQRRHTIAGEEAEGMPSAKEVKADLATRGVFATPLDKHRR